jgi:RND superfamily putative drug exporter
LFVTVVVLLSFLLLAMVFRSVLVPLVAALMNLLSAGAAFGALTAAYVWGWGGSAIGASRAGPIEAFLPVMLFAILFGLSMDYQVFLVSRIHEEWQRSGDNREAVRRGLALTGRTITAAAAIMILVFGSFILGSDRVIKEFGFGLAGAILVDAFLIRVAIVPALMYLLGKRNWWFPARLDRTLPRLAVDPQEDEAPPTRELVHSGQ